MASARNRWDHAVERLGALLRCSRGFPQRQLHLCETLQLGERRFVAVVEFERRKFLIGGSGTSVCLLTALGGGEGTAPPTNDDGIREFAFTGDGQLQTVDPLRQRATG